MQICHLPEILSELKAFEVFAVFNQPTGDLVAPNLKVLIPPGQLLIWQSPQHWEALGLSVQSKISLLPLAGYQKRSNLGLLSISPESLRFLISKLLRGQGFTHTLVSQCVIVCIVNDGLLSIIINLAYPISDAVARNLPRPRGSKVT